jgi:protein O-GlcNAc transferase
VTASINAVIGLGEYTAMNPADYVERAVRLWGDPSPLVELRPRMREMMRASALMDAPAFADRVERAYRTLWHRWLSSTDA